MRCFRGVKHFWPLIVETLTIRYNPWDSDRYKQACETGPISGLHTVNQWARIQGKSKNIFGQRIRAMNNQGLFRNSNDFLKHEIYERKAEDTKGIYKLTKMTNWYKRKTFKDKQHYKKQNFERLINTNPP